MNSVSAKLPSRRRLTLRPLAEQTGRVPAGSLIVSDFFTSSAESHGVSVAKAAWDLGFEGEIFYQQAVHEPKPPQQEHMRAASLLATPGLGESLARTSFQKFVVGPPLHMLLAGIDEVRTAGESQGRNSVLNLSSGTCKAQSVSNMYNLASLAWKADDPEQNDAGRAVVGNLSTLLQIEPDALLDSDPRRALQERQKLQQGLIDAVDEIWDSEPRIAEYREEFAEAVARFESGHNSVVIAAGNEGLVLPILEQASGASLRVPADFEKNVLDVDEVTAVGATIILDGQEAPARYSSSWPGVDFYMSGDREMGLEFDDSTGLGQAGTSLAAPRVAALMARMHGLYPSRASEQVEKELVRDVAPGKVPVVDILKAQLRLRELRGN